MKYIICEYCGSNLDPGERCDCQREEAKRNDKIQKFIDSFFSFDGSGQLQMNMFRENLKEG